MAFQPTVNQELLIGGACYRITEHPVAPGMPYGQEGRQAIVYQLTSDDDGQRRALKVFKPHHRVPSLVGLADQLAAFADLPGLAACRRTVLNARRHDELLRTYPDLTYAVLMPWIAGPTWMEVLLEKRDLTPEQSLYLARALAETLAGMEEQGLAHCDLSGPNVLLPGLLPGAERGRSTSAVGLVDVEQMYGPGLHRPHLLPGGSPGYAHRTAPDGLWSSDADRFAGAILIAEMLSWCDPQIRDQCWGETYFHPTEAQQESDRYRLLLETLSKQWGADAGRLFERAWRSGSLVECPTFGEWLVVLPKSTPQRGFTVSAAGAKPVSPAEATGGATQALIDLAEELVRQGNNSAALTAYRQAAQTAPPTSALRSRIAQRIQELDTLDKPVRSQIMDEAKYSSPQVAPQSLRVASGISDEKWQPAIGAPSRNALLWRFVLVFAGVGSALAGLVLLFPGLLASISYNVWLMGGEAAFNGLGVGALALAISLVQVWIFRERVRGQQKPLFILITVLSGAIGGAIGGVLLQSGKIGRSELGLVAGAITGILTSFGQSFMIHNEAKSKWLVWNTIGWALALYAGGALSLAVGGWSGTAIGAGLIMIILGVSLVLFLRLSPEFEF